MTGQFRARSAIVITRGSKEQTMLSTVVAMEVAAAGVPGITKALNTPISECALEKPAYGIQ